MAEIIGIVATVVQLAGTAATVSLTLYDCGKAYKNAKSELDDLAADVFDLSTVLELLVEVLNKFEDNVKQKPRNTITELIQRCNKVLEELKLSADLIGSKSGRLQWLFRKSKVKELKSSLEGFKSNISLIIQTVTLANSLEKETKRQSQTDSAPSISPTTQRNINLLRNAVLGSRRALRKLVEAEQELEENAHDPVVDSSQAVEQEIAEREFKFDLERATANASQLTLVISNDENTWEKVLLKSYGTLKQEPPASETLSSAIPSRVFKARQGDESKNPTAKSFTTEAGDIETDADQEVVALLQEWTETPESVIESCLQAEKKIKKTYLNGVPNWVNENYQFVGYDAKQPEHWEKKHQDDFDDRSESLLPYSRFAFEPADPEASPLCNVLANEGGGWVWRHDSGKLRTYFVGKKKVIQYFLKPYEEETNDTSSPTEMTILGKQWVSKIVLEESGYPFKDYGEGSYMIQKKLSPQDVEQLHIKSSQRTEILLRRIAEKSGSQQKNQKEQNHDAVPEKPKMQRALALFDFHSDSRRDLPFQKNDILEVYGNLTGEWWTASLNGKKGDIPANYVRILDDDLNSAGKEKLSDKWKKRFDRFRRVGKSGKSA